MRSSLRSNQIDFHLHPPQNQKRGGQGYRGHPGYRVQWGQKLFASLGREDAGVLDSCYRWCSRWMLHFALSEREVAVCLLVFVSMFC